MRRDAVGGMVGLLAIAIALAALPIAPAWPAADAPTDVVRAYFVDHGKQFLMQTFLAWVGFVGFSRVLVGLANVVIEGGERAAGHTAIVGTAVMTAALVFGNVPWAALAYEPPESADAVRALWNVGLISAFNVAGISVALALFPLGVGLLRTKQLPAYYTYMVLGTAVIGTVLATCFGRGGPMAPNGPIGMLSIVTLTAVLLVGSLLLLRKKVS
ncbi:MAG TPA: hypothetical protein VIF62_34685 [Labilithrix sp.]